MLDSTTSFMTRSEFREWLSQLTEEQVAADRANNRAQAIILTAYALRMTLQLEPHAKAASAGAESCLPAPGPAPLPSSTPESL